MTVLIITHSQDTDSISMVMDAIAARGGKAFRFDTDRFPTEVGLEAYYVKDTERVILSFDRRKLDLQEVSAVWYRRIRMGEGIPKTVNSQLRNASILESRVTVHGAIASIDAFHLDPLHVIRRAEHKQLQLKVARELGIDTPRTLTTNNPDTVRQLLLNAWKPYQLPKDVERKLLKLMAYFGLNYGAIDIIVTPDGRHVFLEVNPVGEFFWLEHCPGLPISQAIAEILLKPPHSSSDEWQMAQELRQQKSFTRWIPAPMGSE